jgi:addiction module HigA family antidote
MTANKLTDQIQLPINQMIEILTGTQAITGDTALRLRHFFETSADFWMNLQKLYELRLAGRQAGDFISTLPTLDKRIKFSSNYSVDTR